MEASIALSGGERKRLMEVYRKGNDPARRLRATMAAARVSFTWFGVQKTLTREQKAQAAEAFDAEGQFLSAGKKLLDTRHSAFRAVTSCTTPQSRHTKWW